MSSGTSSYVRQKSGASRTSISVKLPTAQETEDGRRSIDSFQNEGVDDQVKNVVQDDRRKQLNEAALEPSRHNQTHNEDVRQPPAQPQRVKKPTLHQRLAHQQKCVGMIERAWISYRDCQMFRLLKHAVCAAENSLTTEILRKVSPKEADLLSDKSQQIKVRFRFGGAEFPPMIFFKLFINTNGAGVKYISGKKVIKTNSGAAEDSLRQMGNRLFYEQLLQDNIHQKKYKITDEIDVTTLKDYMQYLANLDETPAYMGGKENYWRKLTLDVVPRHTMFYDVVEYLYSHRLSDRLRSEVPLLMVRPINQTIQRQHIKIVSQFRPLPMTYTAPVSTRSGDQRSQSSARRSRQARRRAQKMRRAFGIPDIEESEGSFVMHEGMEEGYQHTLQEGPEGEEDEWEEEANKLYEWTQELSFEDITSTPRIVT